MATTSTLLLTTALLATLIVFQLANAATKPAPVATAPAPTPETLDLTHILEKGSHFTTFLRLLKETQIGMQIDNQIKDSFGGMTVFAPTDSAFGSLKAGALNGLNPQEQAALILYHVLPRYYSPTTFLTTSNPISTQATGNNGAYVVNITSTSNGQVNISTGVNETPINTALYNSFPLAVYEIDSVLLPYDLFGPKPLVPPPEPSVVKPKSSGSKTPSTSTGGTSADSTSGSEGVGRGIGRWRLSGGVGLMISVWMVGI